MRTEKIASIAARKDVKIVINAALLSTLMLMVLSILRALEACVDRQYTII